MKTITRFTNPEVLSQIGVEVLTAFFEHFKDDLKERNFPMPYVNSGEEDFFGYLAHVFTFPSELPLAMVQSVVAVETLASPENKAHLETAFLESPSDLCIPPDASPERTALQLWLHAPYQLNPEAASPEECPVVQVPYEPGMSVLREAVRQISQEPAAEQVEPRSAPESKKVVESQDPEPTGNPESPDSNQTHAGEEAPEAEAEEAPKRSPWNRTRNGRVARLRKEVRDRINQLMLDGVPYRKIIELLGDDGKSLNEDSLVSWKKGGYLDARKEEMELTEIRLRHEYAKGVAAETEGTSLCEGTSKMLVGQIMDALRHSGPNSLQEALMAKPEIYVRLINSVARLSSAALSCEQQRLREAQAKANLEKEKLDPADRSITEETVSQIDHMLRNH